jgi:hypothetical protein
MQSSFLQLNIPAPPPRPTKLQELEQTVHGCRARLDRSIQAIREFHAEHMLLIGKEFFFKSDHVQARDHLQATLHDLYIERDESQRQFAKVCSDFAAEKRRVHERS